MNQEHNLFPWFKFLEVRRDHPGGKATSEREALPSSPPLDVILQEERCLLTCVVRFLSVRN